jgi:hypothetical protein
MIIYKDSEQETDSFNQSLSRFRPKPGCSISDRTEALVRGFVLLLEHHSTSKMIVSELTSYLRSFLNKSVSEQFWVARVKDLLTRPLALFLKNAPPERKLDFDYYEFTGKLRRWYRARLNDYSNRNIHLWYSWLQLKRCTLEVSSDYVAKTYEEHRLALTAPDRGVEGTIQRVMENPCFLEVLEHVKETVQKNYRQDVLSTLTPSSNASYESSRRELGSAGYLRRVTGVEEEIPLLSELCIMRDHIHFLSSDGYIGHKLLEYRMMPVHENWFTILNLIKEQDNQERHLACQIQAILEPMKVRVISKGEAVPYYFARRLQKVLHSSIRHLPCFRLVGESFDSTMLNDLVSDVESDWEWFSVDYSAATDRLSWKYASRIFEMVTAGVPEEERSYLMRVLKPHYLTYPRIKGFVGPQQGFLQTTGQLMGSVLSFPILCLANLGVYLDVMSSTRGWDTQTLIDHVLINGDDMLYCAPSHKWEAHVVTAGELGLDMSLGKAYHHHSYANINSVSVNYKVGNASLGRGHPWRIDFLNSGLFFGQHKVQGKADSGDEQKSESCAVNLTQILQGSLPGRQASLTSEFLKFNSDKIRKETLFYLDGVPCSRNVFLPTCVGGLGVPSPIGFKFRITLEQRILASIIARNLVISARPIQGYEVNQEQSLLRRVYDYMPAETEPSKVRSLSTDKPIPKRKLMVAQVLCHHLPITVSI